MDARAFGGQRERQAAADAGRGAGDERGAIVLVHPLLPSRWLASWPMPQHTAVPAQPARRVSIAPRRGGRLVKRAFPTPTARRTTPVSATEANSAVRMGRNTYGKSGTDAAT